MKFESEEEGKLSKTLYERAPEEKNIHFEKTLWKSKKDQTDEPAEGTGKKKMGKLKKLLIALGVLLVVGVVLIVTLGRSQSVKRELKKYVEESVPMYVSIESDYAEAYSKAMTDPSISDAETYEIVTGKCIPTIDALLETIKSQKIRNGEIKDLHNIYIEYIEKVRNMLQVTKEAYDEMNREKALSLTELSAEAIEVGNRYYTELERLCREKGVETPD